MRSFLQRYRDMDRDGRERLALKMADSYQRKTRHNLSAEIPDGYAAHAFLASLLRDLDEFLRHG